VTTDLPSTASMPPHGCTSADQSAVGTTSASGRRRKRGRAGQGARTDDTLVGESSSATGGRHRRRRFRVAALAGGEPQVPVPRNAPCSRAPMNAKAPRPVVVLRSDLVAPADRHRRRVKSGMGQGSEHPAERIICEQVALLDIGSQRGIALVSAELLEPGGGVRAGPWRCSWHRA